MTDKCKFCNGTKREPGVPGPCVWCQTAAEALAYGTSMMLMGEDGVKHVPLKDMLLDLKPFRTLPYGTKFRYQGTTDVWVRTQHNVVAEWPGRLRTPTNEPIQSLCCFCHLDGDEDGNTLDTLVEVVDLEPGLRDALSHIEKTANQSRTMTRRLRWIAKRAELALAGRPYVASEHELPPNVDSEHFKLLRQKARLKERNEQLEALLTRCHNSDNLSQNCGLWKDLAAALKPTESGASE